MPPLLGLIAACLVVALLVGIIICYHVLLDRRYARETRRSASAPTPAAPAGERRSPPSRPR
jgi:hypothetical protein